MRLRYQRDALHRRFQILGLHVHAQIVVLRQQPTIVGIVAFGATADEDRVAEGEHDLIFTKPYRYSLLG